MRYIVLFLIALPLFGAKDNIFVGFGGGLGTTYRSNFWQQTTKDNASCAGGTCIGNKTSGSYEGKSNNSFVAMLGNEAFFDKYYMTGLRIYGSVEYASVSLGNLIPTSVAGQPAKDTHFKTITGMKDSTTPIIGEVPMQKVPNPQDYLFNNGMWMSYSVNLDFFLNLPLDNLVRLFWNKMPFFKVGVYAGGGVEYSILMSSSWENKTIGKNEKFYASGSGFFVNLGGSIYVGRHNRINVGLKIPYYGLNAQNWYDFGDTNPWKQQLLRQNFDITRGREWRISYVYLF